MFGLTRLLTILRLIFDLEWRGIKWQCEGHHLFQLIDDIPAVNGRERAGFDWRPRTTLQLALRPPHSKNTPRRPSMHGMPARDIPEVSKKNKRAPKRSHGYNVICIVFLLMRVRFFYKCEPTGTCKKIRWRKITWGFNRLYTFGQNAWRLREKGGHRHANGNQLIFNVPRWPNAVSRVSRASRSEPWHCEYSSGLPRTLKSRIKIGICRFLKNRVSDLG